MAAKKDLANLLGEPQKKPEIRRGRGVWLSTEQAADEQVADTENAESQNRRNAESRNRESAMGEQRRVNRGYALREDLIKACKRLALEQDRKLYEVMEAALEEYVKRHTAK